MGKLVSLVLFLLLMGIIPIALTDCCRCKDPGPDKLALIDTLNVSTWSGPDVLKFYPYESVTISISIDQHRIIGKAEIPVKYAPVSLTSSAFACSCKDEVINLQNKISAIQLISQTDTTYNDSLRIRKGDLLNELFNIKSDFYTKTLGTTISDYLTLNGGNYIRQRLDLYLVSKPKHPLPLQFDILISLSNGKTLTYPNESLRIR